MNDSNPGYPAAAPEAAAQRWQLELLRWSRRILASNPLYLASAGFVLYGLNRLSSDPRLTGAETALLGFNFGALFLYELLLVLTAIVLARRSIWYDALLLVGLENLFVLIPFSLVSRTVLLNRPLAWAMCAAAVVMALAKFWALKRFLPALNFSRRLLWFGVLVMAANVGIGLGFQRFEFDRPTLMNWLNTSWLVLLPALLILPNFLPARSRLPASSLMARWFPEAMFGIWMAVTAVHLGGVGYVFEFKWQLPLLAPALCALAWTWLNRTSSLTRTQDSWLARGLLSGPLLLTWVAIQQGSIFAGLNALNFIVYGLFCVRPAPGQRRVWGGLCLCSLLSAAAGVPAEWAQSLLPDFTRASWILFCVAALMIGWTAVVRDPRWSFLSAIGVFSITRWMLPLQGAANLAVQAALLFLILHSLGWQDRQHRGAALLRIACVLLWTAHSYAWVRSGPNEAIGFTCSLASVVLVSCVARRWLTRRWGPLVIPAGAMLVMFAAPVNLLGAKLKGASPGYLSLVAGFILFLLGTWLAFSKARWKRDAVQS